MGHCTKQYQSKGKRRSKEQLAQFESQIIQLRRNGVSFEKIAQATGDSLSNCHKAYQRACARLPTTDQEQMRLFLDQQLEAVFQKSMALAQKGEVSALREARGALAQRADLFGLNAPVTTKTELRVRAKITTTGRRCAVVILCSSTRRENHVFQG